MASAKYLRPIVISGPSGVGKGTLISMLFKKFPDSFAFSISHTTRLPRTGEENGREYHFVQKQDFCDLIDKDGFIEYAKYSGNLYGTSVQAIKDIQETGKRPILDIELQGVKIVKEKHAYLNPIFVFISPPSLSALGDRLRNRKTDTEDSIKTRLETALVEIECASQPDFYDAIIVNDHKDHAYKLLEKAVTAETIKKDDFDKLPSELTKRKTDNDKPAK